MSVSIIWFVNRYGCINCHFYLKSLTWELSEVLPDPKENSSLFELHFHSTSWKQPILTKGDTGAATEANCDKSKSITATIVEEYASNQEQWVLDFADVYDRMMANGYDINQLQVSVMTVIVNPIHGGLYRDLHALSYPSSGKTLLPEGGHYGPPSFFQLWGYQKLKTEPSHIFGTKINLKKHFEQF